MKILTTSAEAQTLSFIPRTYAASGTLVIRDDSTNVVLTSSETLTKVGEYLTISKVFSLVESRFYDFKVVVDGVDIYRDKIFCTDQVINQDSNFYYSVNDGMENNLSERVSLGDGVFEDSGCLEDVLKDVDGREYIKDTSYDNDYIII